MKTLFNLQKIFHLAILCLAMMVLVNCKKSKKNEEPLPEKAAGITLDYIVFDDCYSFKPADPGNSIVKLKFSYHPNKTVSKVEWRYNLFGSLNLSDPFYENREYNSDQKIWKVGSNTPFKEYFYNTSGQLSKINVVNGYDTTKEDEWTIEETDGEKILKAKVKRFGGQLGWHTWQYQYIYNASGNLIELDYYKGHL